MNKLYDALEYCLQALEDGASMDTVLARYPDLVDELRPILEASLAARRMAAPAPSVETVRRGRVRLLQRTSELRAVRRPGRRFIPFFQRMAFALALAGVFLLSGTGLVSASSTALPGENLYPVKRTWEDVRLLFVFDPTHREALEGEYEQDRLEEVAELLREGRTASITFSGVVTSRQDNLLIVSNVPVTASVQTRYSGNPLAVGMSVMVTGHTQPDGGVSADEVLALPAGSLVPTGEMESAAEAPAPTVIGQVPTPVPDNGNSSPSGNDAGGGEQSEKRTGTFHLEGTIQSINGNIVVVQGQTVYLDQSQLGRVTIGAQVEVKGYFTVDGRFIVTSVEVKSSGSGDGSQDGNKNNNSGNEDSNNSSGGSGGGEDGGSDNNGGDDGGDDSGVIGSMSMLIQEGGNTALLFF